MTERLEDHEWLETAETMVLGESRKIPHSGCSSSNSMKVSHDENGLRAYCFKCQRYGFKANKIDTLEQAAIIEAHREAKRQQTDSVVAPADLSHPEADPRSLSWLLGHGITFQEIKHFKIRYSPSLERVFIPVYHAGKLINYIGRTVSKYDSVKWWALSKNQMPYFDVTCPACPYPTLCLVEDILSAIKVGRHIDCYAMMGTTPSKELFNRLKYYKHILVWTDGDKAGDKAYDIVVKFCKRYYTQLKVSRIRTANDPKRYDNNFIREQLGYGHTKEPVTNRQT